MGYFSKEKVSAEEYNLACILTFPQYQKHGYGKFIISLSYELTKREEKTGSPEKPLSDLGKISYRSYWTDVLLHLLAKHDPTTQDISIKDISIQTGIKTEDIISTLQYLDMIKCWKGQHVVYVKQDMIDQYMKQKYVVSSCLYLLSLFLCTVCVWFLQSVLTICIANLGFLLSLSLCALSSCLRPFYTHPHGDLLGNNFECANRTA